MTRLVARMPASQLPGWFTAIVLVWVAAMTAVPWAVVAVLGDRLPDPVAVHWGIDGQPNGFEPLATAWVVPTIMTAGLSLFLLGLGVALRQIRLLVPFVVGLATFLAAVFGWPIAAQANAEATASSADAGVVAGLVLGLLSGVLAGLAMRRWVPRVLVPRPRGALPASAPRIGLPVGGRAVWLGRARYSAAADAVPWVVLVLLVGIAAAIAAYEQWVMAGVIGLIGVAVALLVHGFLRATVVVDAAGVRVRVMRVATVVTIPLVEIVSAEPATVHWGEFGGMGLRARLDTDGSMGLITASGEAVRVNRAGTGPFFLTVAPATEVVAVINGLVARQDAARARP